MRKLANAARVLQQAVFISIVVFLIGVILLLISYQMRQPSSEATSEILRDLGIVLCSIGCISLLYEMLIRRQLLADYNNALQDILDPDTRKLGVRALFRDRDDKTLRGRSLDALLRSTCKEMLCLGLGFYQLIPEKRDLLLTKIREGCSFRFLIFDPTSKNAAALDESLGYGNGSLIKFLGAQQGYFVEFMKALADEGLDGRFQVRTYEAVPTFGALAVDSSVPEGYLIVELYGAHVEGSVCPRIELVPRESAWYAFYDRQIAELWKVGQPLAPAETKAA